MAAAPPVVTYRSVYRGRLIGAYAGWLLEETASHIVVATVPGADTLQLDGDRIGILRDLAHGCEQTRRVAWERNRVVWFAPFNTAWMLGMFWNDASDTFLGYY